MSHDHNDHNDRNLRISDLQSSVARMSRVVLAAYEKVKEARKAVAEAEKVYHDLSGPYGAQKVLTSTVMLGRFQVEVAIAVRQSYGDTNTINTTHHIRFTLGKEHLLWEDIMFNMTSDDLIAYRRLKTTVEDFLAGKTNWPYPHQIE